MAMAIATSRRGCNYFYNSLRFQRYSSLPSRLRYIINTMRKPVPSFDSTIANQPRRSLFSNPFRSPTKKKEYRDHRLVGYSADEVFQVVADVTDYAEFIPWCRSSKVVRPIPNGFLATLEVGFPPISETYTSTVTLVRPTLARAVCKDGKIFKYLESTWKFSPGLANNPYTCFLEFEIIFEFNSIIHDQLSSIFFEDVVKKMIGAFDKRCLEIHGPDRRISHIDPIYKITNI